MLIILILLSFVHIFIITKIIPKVIDQKEFKYFDKISWIMAVIWAPLIGPALYMILENKMKF